MPDRGALRGGGRPAPVHRRVGDARSGVAGIVAARARPVHGDAGRPARHERRGARGDSAVRGQGECDGLARRIRTQVRRAGHAVHAGEQVPDTVAESGAPGRQSRVRRCDRQRDLQRQAVRRAVRNPTQKRAF